MFLFIEIRDLYLNLDQTSISSDKDESSFVTTCSTFVNPESSITDKHLPPTNASPRIRLYFDILSNEILKKGPAQTGGHRKSPPFEEEPLIID